MQPLNKEDFSGLYSIRDGISSDNSFILATFLRGLHGGNDWFNLIPREIFFKNYEPVIRALIESPKAEIKIACLPDDPGVILGYSILSADHQAVHWVYIKKVWRSKGIGKSLIPEDFMFITHLSAVGRDIMTKYPKAVFNPFKI